METEINVALWALKLVKDLVFYSCRINIRLSLRLRIRWSPVVHRHVALTWTTVDSTTRPT